MWGTSKKVLEQMEESRSGISRTDDEGGRIMQGHFLSWIYTMIRGMRARAGRPLSELFTLGMSQALSQLGWGGLWVYREASGEEEAFRCSPGNACTVCGLQSGGERGGYCAGRVKPLL